MSPCLSRKIVKILVYLRSWDDGVHRVISKRVITKDSFVSKEVHIVVKNVCLIADFVYKLEGSFVTFSEEYFKSVNLRPLLRYLQYANVLNSYLCLRLSPHALNRRRVGYLRDSRYGANKPVYIYVLVCKLYSVCILKVPLFARLPSPGKLNCFFWSLWTRRDKVLKICTSIVEKVAREICVVLDTSSNVKLFRLALSISEEDENIRILISPYEWE